MHGLHETTGGRERKKVKSQFSMKSILSLIKMNVMIQIWVKFRQKVILIWSIFFSSNTPRSGTNRSSTVGDRVRLSERNIWYLGYIYRKKNTFSANSSCCIHNQAIYRFHLVANRSRWLTIAHNLWLWPLFRRQSMEMKWPFYTSFLQHYVFNCYERLFGVNDLVPLKVLLNGNRFSIYRWLTVHIIYTNI